MQERLTDAEYWESVHASPGEGPPHSGMPGARLRRLVGPRVFQYFEEYPRYLLWDVLLSRYLEPRPGAKALEVGSAPGQNLIELHRRFGFEPYGVEYTARGAEVNRRLFARHGFPPERVIQDDFLSAAFQDQYAQQFDLVLSFGFIEHFADVGDVIAKHLAVLAPGGRLVITIPNLRGLNYVLAWLFNRPVLRLHNMAVMRQRIFCDLFAQQDVAPLVCRYYGTFSFGLFNTSAQSPKRYVLRGCGRAQRLLNALFRACFGTRGAESAILSPYLIFVGVKPRVGLSGRR